MESILFRAEPVERANGGIRLVPPLAPAAVWGERDAYHVIGTIGGHLFRASLTPANGWAIELGPAWCRHPSFRPGDEVAVVMALEGPQSTTMGADAAAAFAAEPDAKRFFDSMPTFYRKNVARGLADAKRPETRARRIAEAVQRAREGRREG